ncbi:MAG: lipopolysaccharide biosynthesis protein [Actinomycetes bacterium]
MALRSSSNPFPDHDPSPHAAPSPERVPAPALLRLPRAVLGGLPRGTLDVGVGLAVLGVAAYVYLAVAGRALGPERFAALSVVWVLVFTVGPGLFVPLEQEIGRAVAERRARHVGGLPVLRTAALLGAVFAVGVLVLLAAASPVIVPALFRGNGVLLVMTGLAVVSLAVAYPSRGALAGSGRFRRYGAQLSVEGALRVAVAVGLWVAGVRSTGAFALALALPALVAALVTVPPPRRLLDDGPHASVHELSGRIGLLLGISLMTNSLVNAGPVLVQALASPSEKAAAGVFLAALIVARVPLFLFSAVQAVMLPRLASLAAVGAAHDFTRLLYRVLLLVGSIGAVGVLGCLTVGPEVIVVFFGGDFAFPRTDLVLLAVASAAYMVGVALTQVLVALDQHHRALLAWVVGVVVLVLLTLVLHDLLLRVELGFLFGSTSAVLALAILLRTPMAALRGRHQPADGTS